MPWRTNEKELCSLLGIACYYFRFIQSFATISAPLHAVISSKTKLSWTEETEEALGALKKTSTSPPVLKFPDFGNLPWWETDMSAIALMEVVSNKKQKDEDKEIHPVQYASLAMNTAESQNCTSDLVELFMFCQINKRWSACLQGKISMANLLCGWNFSQSTILRLSIGREMQIKLQNFLRALGMVRKERMGQTKGTSYASLQRIPQFVAILLCNRMAPFRMLIVMLLAIKCQGSPVGRGLLFIIDLWSNFGGRKVYRRVQIVSWLSYQLQSRTIWFGHYMMSLATGTLEIHRR